jgi:hypothetical protein
MISTANQRSDGPDRLQHPVVTAGYLFPNINDQIPYLHMFPSLVSSINNLFMVVDMTIILIKNGFEQL